MLTVFLDLGNGKKMFKSKNCIYIITRYRDGGRSENLGRQVCKYGGAQRAKFTEKVDKPTLGVNVIDFELNGFNAFIWVPWSTSGHPKM